MGFTLGVHWAYVIISKVFLNSNLFINFRHKNKIVIFVLDSFWNVLTRILISHHDKIWIWDYFCAIFNWLQTPQVAFSFTYHADLMETHLWFVWIFIGLLLVNHRFILFEILQKFFWSFLGPFFNLRQLIFKISFLTENKLLKLLHCERELCGCMLLSFHLIKFRVRLKKDLLEALLVDLVITHVELFQTKLN